MRGRSPRQIGVTEAMIATYGDFVWERSNNLQIRRGDPVRALDFAAIEAQRPGLGMTDGQIADVLGLSREQVTRIRIARESRGYDRRNALRLYDLGGNNRFRAERHRAAESDAGFDADALELRDSVRVGPEEMRRYVETGQWSADTLSGWLDRNVARAPTAPAVVGGGEPLSYAELADRAKRVAEGLYGLGVRPGDVVSVQLPNTPDYLVAYLAIMRLGAVLSTIHMPYRSADMAVLMGHARSRAFIGLSRLGDFAPAAEALRLKESLPSLAHVVALGEPVPGAVAFDDLSAGAAPLPPSVRAWPADPFLLLFTSGTSTSPKAVPLSAQMTLGNARMDAPEHGLGSDDIILSASPYTHLLGLYSIHLAMCAGAACLVLPAFSPANMLAAIERERPTVLFTAPAHLTALRNAGLLERADLSSLRLVVASGSACPPDLVRAVGARMPHGKFTQLWGMTELQAGLFTRPGDSLEFAATTAGRPAPGCEVRVVDLDDRPCPAGAEGELQIRGSFVFAGYLRNDEANRQAFTADGWFHTGDFAVIDASGAVAITGRIKEVINRGGIKYNPRDIEDHLIGHPKIAHAAIVPYADPALGERACCFVVPQGDQRLELAELCDYLLARGVAKVKLPERIEIIEQMPTTPTGKIIRRRLRDLLPEGA